MKQIFLLFAAFYFCCAFDALSSVPNNDSLQAAYFEQLSLKSIQQNDYQTAFSLFKTSDSLKMQYWQQRYNILQNNYLQLEQQVLDADKTHDVHPDKTRKVYLGILIFLLVDVVGLFVFLYMEKQRAYLKLVRKNMEWAAQTNRENTIVIYHDEESAVENQPLDQKERELVQRCIHLLKNEKTYLKSDLTLQEMAKQLNCNKNALSKIINTCFNKSFPALLNEYRIREAIYLLTKSKSNNYKLEVIGEMCGYKNRQVFHLAFKKATGVTPNNFRKMSGSKDFIED
jgi:YesN/AraC family two-component response regulator